MLVNTARLAGLDIKMMTTELTDVWRLVELHRHHQQQIQDLPRGGGDTGDYGEHAESL